MNVNVRQVRRYVSPFLIALGLVLVSYVVAQYGHMYLEQRRLAQMWEEQQHTPRTTPAAVPDDGLTRLTVPKIALDSVVVEGTSRKALMRGPGHLENSAPPGEAGNSVITGHRDTFFRHIYELEKGDMVLLRRQGKTFRYEVTGKQIVEPDDLSVVSQSRDARLTLITCYPTYYIGPAPKRLVVFSKLVDQADGSSEKPALERATAKSGVR